MPSVFEMEKHLIAPEEWEEHRSKIPSEQWASLNSGGGGGGGGPIGLGFMVETGYFILASGQGPFLVWMEKTKTT